MELTAVLDRISNISASQIPLQSYPVHVLKACYILRQTSPPVLYSSFFLTSSISCNLLINLTLVKSLFYTSLFHSLSHTTLHRFLWNAMPYAKISHLPFSLSASSYLRFLICAIAFSHALSRPLIDAACFTSMIMPASGFSGSMRISLYPSPDSLFDDKSFLSVPHALLYPAR